MALTPLVASVLLIWICGRALRTQPADGGEAIVTVGGMVSSVLNEDVYATV